MVFGHSQSQNTPRELRASPHTSATPAPATASFGPDEQVPDGDVDRSHIRGESRFGGEAGSEGAEEREQGSGGRLEGAYIGRVRERNWDSGQIGMNFYTSPRSE